MMEKSGQTAPDKLSIVVFSGDFDKIHYALVMAAAAVASNTPVTLFFTMWAGRALLQGKGWQVLKTFDGRSGAEMDQEFRAKKVAGFEELLEACLLLGVKFMVCEMGIRALGMEMGDLRPDIPIEAGGVVSFLADASKNGGMLFI